MVLHIRVNFTSVSQKMLFILNGQRPIAQKVIKPDLWFLCSTCHLMLLYVFAGRQENQEERAQYMTGINIYNAQRVVTQNAGKSGFWFFVFCTSYHGDIHLHKVIICFQITKGHKSKTRLSRVMVLVFCTSSHAALLLCEVL